MDHKPSLVYSAISFVMADIAKEGISKDRKNDKQGYKFRGIDDVYNALSPILAKHHLVMLPRVLSRENTERKNSSGNPLFYVVVEVEFTLISAEDGSAHVIKTYGEAMDSGDKATNKAMSAAYKYAAMQAFCIPTEGDNDADSQTHEVAPKPVSKPEMTLDDRAANFLKLARDCKTAEALNALTSKAAAVKLKADLERSDPEMGVQIEQEIEVLFESLADEVKK